MKCVLKLGLKGKIYTGWKREFRWPVVARQPDLGLMLCWMCAHTAVLFKPALPIGSTVSSPCTPRVLIPSAAPIPALGMTGLNC